MKIILKYIVCCLLISGAAFAQKTTFYNVKNYGDKGNDKQPDNKVIDLINHATW